MKTKLFLALCFLIPSFIWLTFGNQFALNFTFALFSFLIIVASVFYTQKKKILKLINHASKDELEALIETYKSKQERLEEIEGEFFTETQKCHNSLEDIDCKNTAKSQNIKQYNFFTFFKKDSKKIYLQNKNIQATKEIPQKERSFWNSFNATNAKIGIGIFFFPLRLLSYSVLIVGILILIHHQMFNTLAFFCGLIFANILLISVAIFGFFEDSK